MSQAVLIAIGIDWDGRRQILAVELANRESRSSGGTSSSAAQTRSARRRVRRRRRSCRPAGSPARGSGRGGLPALLRALPAQRARSPAAQGRRRLPAGAALALRPRDSSRGAPRSRRLARQMGRAIPEAHRLGRGNIEETLTFYRLPRQHHKHLKSTNMLERLNEEIRRRTHVVRIFPNGEAACGSCGHSPSRPTRTGSKPIAISTWTISTSTRKSSSAKPHNSSQP